jgi:hypothetical protein
MRQINVAVADEVYEASKVAAAQCGMKFKRWVERALADACDPRNLPLGSVDPRKPVRTLDYTEGQ